MSESALLRVLVTGASGFLGGNILRALRNNAQIRPIAACRDRDKISHWFDGEIRVGDLTDAFLRADLRLIDSSGRNGVRRFIFANTVAIAAKVKDGRPIDEFSPKRHTGYWPHLDRLIDIDDYMRANSTRGMRMVNLRLGSLASATAWDSCRH